MDFKGPFSEGYFSPKANRRVGDDKVHSILIHGLQGPVFRRPFPSGKLGVGQIGSVVHVSEVIDVEENVEVALINMGIVGISVVSMAAIATRSNSNKWKGIGGCAGGSSKRTTPLEHTADNDSDASRGVDDRHLKLKNNVCTEHRDRMRVIGAV